MYCWVEIIFCDHTNKVEITQQLGRIQNCCQIVFNRGALRLRGGAWHCENKKSSWFIVFTISYFNLGGLQLFWEDISPPKPPQSDATGWNQLLSFGEYNVTCCTQQLNMILKISRGPIASLLPQVVGLPTINNIACKLQKLVPVQTLYCVYARFRIFVVLKDFENSGGPIARLPISPPGCGPAYHQLNNIACKLQKLVPVQKLYRVYARFITSKVQGCKPPASFLPP